MSQIYPPSPPMADHPSMGEPPWQPETAAAPPSVPASPKVSVWRRLATVAVAIVALIGGILAGMVVFRPAHSSKVAATPTTAVAPGPGDGPGPMGRPFGGRGFADREPRLRGTITATANGTLTVSTFSGETVKVRLTGATEVMKIALTPTGGVNTREISPRDLATGDVVSILGSRQGDTVTASRVTVGDFGGPFGGRGPSGPP